MFDSWELGSGGFRESGFNFQGGSLLVEGPQISLFSFYTLVSGPRRSLSLELSDTRRCMGVRVEARSPPRRNAITRAPCLGLMTGGGGVRGLRVQGFGCGVKGVGCEVSGVECWVAGCRVQGEECGVQDQG